jgi:hypothetical protein
MVMAMAWLVALLSLESWRQTPSYCCFTLHILLLLLPQTELGDGQGYGMVGGVAFTRTKEKNRLAQQRFRAKQKNMVATLKTRLAELEDLVGFKVCNSCNRV